ncbi:MAG: hypothetical protein ACREDR_05710 [Blastocatellia bacterium]
MRLFLACIALLAFAPAARPQSPSFEYGSPADLHGVTRIYVYTAMDLEVRNNIIKNIQKKLPQIVIADSANDAQVVLSFAADSYTYLATVYHSSNSQTNGTVNATSTPNGNTTETQGTYSDQTNTYGYNTPVYRRVLTGAGLVTMRGADGKLRLIMDYHGTKRNIFQKEPSTKFAKAFIEAYEKANKAEKD